MRCPACEGDVPEYELRCRHCGALIAERAADAYHQEMQARAQAEREPGAPVYEAHMRIPRPVPAPAAPPRPAHGGPAPPAQAAAIRSGPPPPGAGMALASLLCSIGGVLLILTCVLALFSPIPLVMGAVFGFLAMQQLPPDAASHLRSQAQFGLWVGLAGTVFAFIGVVIFGTIFFLGVLEGMAAA